MFELILICAGSLLLHVASKWQEVRDEAKTDGLPLPGIVEFLQDRPAMLVVMAIGAGLSFMVCNRVGMLADPLTGAAIAAACGYMGSSLSKKLVDRASNLVGDR